MPNDFVLPNDPALAKAIGECNSSEQIKETIKAFLENRGVIHRERGDGTVQVTGNQQEQPMRSSPAGSMPVSSGTGSAYRVIYPHGNTRVELFGESEADLDAQEAAIRTLYGRR